MKKCAFILLIFAIVTCTMVGEPEARFYGISTSASDFGEFSALYEINPTTGEARLIHTIPNQVWFGGLTAMGRQLFATSVVDGVDSFGRIDFSGTFTKINNQGGAINWHGLASNESTGIFYSIDIDYRSTPVRTYLKSIKLDGTIDTIDEVKDGHGKPVQGRGLEYDDTHGILYATGETALYTVDTTTALATRVNAPGNPSGMRFDLAGLAYDETTCTLYANDGWIEQSLYKMDTTTGIATKIGSNNAPGAFIDGLAWREDMEFEIDLMPGGSPNCVNDESRGLVTVAILNTPGHDPAIIDQSTIRFGSCDVNVTRCNDEDADGDGDLDLICHFKTSAVTWPAHSTDCGIVTLRALSMRGGDLAGRDFACLHGEATCAGNNAIESVYGIGGFFQGRE